VELVDFNVNIEPSSDSRFRIVRYTAEFINGAGERIKLTRDTRIEGHLLQDPYTAAWLLSHIIRDFISELNVG